MATLRRHSRNVFAALLCVLVALLLHVGAVGAVADARQDKKAPPSPADQTGTLVALPAIAQQGPGPEAPRNDSVLSAAFAPPVPGRPVQLQELVSRKWVTIQTAAQDDFGYAVFSAPVGGTYRARAIPDRRMPDLLTPSVVSRSFALGFEDTFSGDALAPAWQDQLHGYNPGGLRTCAKPSPLARQIGGGTLTLGVMLDPDRLGETCNYVDEGVDRKSPYLLNTQINTRDGYAFRHGVAAARMKLHQPRGMHEAFWLQPTTPPVWGDPSKGVEIDVAEYFGERLSPSGVGAFVHALDASGASVKRGGMFPTTERMKPPGDTWFDSYHVFSVEWSPTGYVFRVDGREFYRLSETVSQTEQYLLLSMLTSDYELNLLKNNPERYSATVSVDWVRVWQPAG